MVKPQRNLTYRYSTFKFSDSTTSVETWETYKNDEHDYEIKYPSTWNMVEQPATYNTPPLYLFEETETKELANNPNISIRIWTDGNFFESTHNGLSPFQYFQKMQNEDVTGGWVDGLLPARVIHETPEDAQTEPSYSINMYFYKSDSKLYEVIAWGSSKSDVDQIVEIYNEMLQSLSFH